MLANNLLDPDMSNKPVDVVRRLVQPVMADNSFSDIILANELKENRLSFVGTLKKNKR